MVLRRATAAGELLLAAALWGFGFIAAVWGMQVFSASEITFLRFALAATLLTFFALRARGRQIVLGSLKTAFLPAFFLSCTLIFQTWGLHYTTPTKSGFITTLYVIFVPILESIISKQRLPWTLWLCVAMALAGTGLIVNVGIDSINLGDVLTFICALAATVQIYWLGVISPRIKQPFGFNLVQAAWGALICAPLVSFGSLTQKLNAWATWPMQAWIGLLALAFGSTVIAFFLQVRAQAHLSATVSSLIFLLESPFALIFALLLLNQSLSLTEALGATLIFMSAAAACLIEARRKKNLPAQA